MITPEINLLFPTVIYQKTDKNLITKNIVKLSKKICLDYGKNSFITNCTTTVETYVDVLNLKEFEKIKEFISNSVLEYCNFLNFDISRGIKVTGSWLNHYNPGELQELHLHHDSLISGSFYIISSGEADFYVRNPSYNYQPILPFLTEENSYNQNNVIYTTDVGKLILFTSATFHGTIPTKKERLSLSFNVTYLN